MTSINLSEVTSGSAIASRCVAKVCGEMQKRLVDNVSDCSLFQSLKMDDNQQEWELLTLCKLEAHKSEMCLPP